MISKIFFTLNTSLAKYFFLIFGNEYLGLESCKMTFLEEFCYYGVILA